MTQIWVVGPLKKETLLSVFEWLFFFLLAYLMGWLTRKWVEKWFFSMFKLCFQYIQNMFTVCSKYVFLCSIDVYDMFNRCSAYVQIMFKIENRDITQKRRSDRIGTAYVSRSDIRSLLCSFWLVFQFALNESAIMVLLI